jgi:hypothetical protein
LEEARGELIDEYEADESQRGGGKLHFG